VGCWRFAWYLIAAFSRSVPSSGKKYGFASTVSLEKSRRVTAMMPTAPAE
jgi:hypothetical protein